MTDLFWYTLKTLENQRFSDVFRGYQKRSKAWNGLTLIFETLELFETGNPTKATDLGNPKQHPKALTDGSIFNNLLRKYGSFEGNCNFYLLWKTCHFQRCWKDYFELSLKKRLYKIIHRSNNYLQIEFRSKDRRIIRWLKNYLRNK